MPRYIHDVWEFSIEVEVERQMDMSFSLFSERIILVLLKRHEEEKVPAYIWVKPWLEGKFDIMKASISVVRKINYDGNVFSSQQERSPVHVENGFAHPY